MASKKARVLRATQIGGKAYQANDLVEGDDKLLKAYENDGSLDSSAGAVSYCEQELKAKPQKLGAKEDKADEKKG